MIRLLVVTALGAVITLAVMGATTQSAAGQGLPDTPTPTETETPPPTATETPPADTATAPAATATVAATALPPTGAGTDGGQSTPWLAIGAAAIGALALASAAVGLRAIRR